VSADVVHANAVAFGPEGGILIEGPSGSGKSTLAMALIEQGADLIADDRTVLLGDGEAVYARCPRAIQGLIEVRGMGLLRLATRRLARIRLVIDLSNPDGGPRLPPPQTCLRLGRILPWLAVRPADAMAYGLGSIMRGPGADELYPLARKQA
jgi:HPr kinase/phosphorylase